MNAEAYKEYQRKYREAHPDYFKKYMQEYRNNHRGKINAYTEEWKQKNREKYTSYLKEWKKENKAKNRSYASRHRAAMINRTPKWVDLDGVDMIYRVAEIAKITLDNMDVEVDHIIPLKGKLVSGLHTRRNLRIISKTENQKKRNKFNPLSFIGP